MQLPWDRASQTRREEEQTRHPACVIHCWCGEDLHLLTVDGLIQIPQQAICKRGLSVPRSGARAYLLVSRRS